MPPEIDRCLIEAQLSRVLASSGFAQAPRQRQFLSFVVSTYLTGDEAALKETTIGVEVFGRKPGYDPTKDAIVRTTASRVRQKLAGYYETDGRSDPWLIELPPDGYVPQIEPRLIEMAPAETPAGHSRALDRVVTEQKEVLKGPGDSAISVWAHWFILAASAGVLVFVAVILLRIRPASDRAPEAVSFSQLTNDGVLKQGPLFTDGSVLYFEEFVDNRLVPVSVPATGGEIHPLKISLGDAILQDAILMDMAPGRRFLIQSVNGHQSTLWEWSPGTSPKLVATSFPNSAGWMANVGRVEAFATQAQLHLYAAHSDKVLPFPGSVSFPRWSEARNSLRFTVGSRTSRTSSLWEMRGMNASPQPLRGFPAGACCGTWTPDGTFFVFLTRSTARGGPRQGTRTGFDIWAVYDGPVGPLAPVRLTQGPLSYMSAVPSPDGSRIFAIGQQELGELVEYNSAAKAFVPFLGGIRALETDFTRDRRWIAYVSYPERTLWKMRWDGRERVQLTVPPLAVIEPHWSPDGTRIAFMGELLDGRRRIYLIAADGGTVEAAPFDPNDQGVPTWSPDGSKIAFGELLYRKPNSEMAVHVLDLKRRTLAELPGSKGVWTPRWSPDGRFILGLTPDFHKLLLFDWQSQLWQELAAFDFIDHPSWSADSTSISFLGVRSAGRDRALYRVNVRERQLMRMVDLKGFPIANFEWYGITPDGAPLALRGVTNTEIYALTLRK